MGLGRVGGFLGLSAGCGGALARKLAREYPSADVSVLDVPRVVEAAKQHFSQADDTIRFVEGELHPAHCSGKSPAW